jgi:hypothetical protein
MDWTEESVELPEVPRGEEAKDLRIGTGDGLMDSKL